MRIELHLDPPLDPPGITMENHEYIEVELEGPDPSVEWFLSLPEVIDRTVVVFPAEPESPVGEVVNLGPWAPDGIAEDSLRVTLAPCPPHLRDWFLGTETVVKYRVQTDRSVE